MREPRPGWSESSWRWVTERGTDLCGCLTFVRGLSPPQVIEGFGIDPAAAQLLPRDRAHEAVPYTVHTQHGPTGCPAIRAGQAGEWAFAFEDPETGSITIAGRVEGVGVRLSAGTEAVVVSWTQTIDSVDYFVDGELVTGFEPLRAYDRAGTDPDRFLPQMRQVGLLDEPPDGDWLHWFETFRPLVAALDMLTVALGIRLIREMIEGPLLTAQRQPGVS